MKRFILLNLIVLMLGANTYAGWLKIPFGRVSSFTGTPLINEKAAKINQKIFVGDVVVTNSNSTIKIKSKKGDIFFIGPDSKVIIRDKKNIKLKSGTLRSIIHKLKPKEAFKVVSGGGVAGVKGTEFIVYANENASAVFTREGKVYLENLNVSVITKKGEMSQSGYKVPPIEPVNFEKDKTLKNMFELLIKVTGFEVPVEMRKFKELPDIIARWNINYTGYLIDKKKFNEALKYLDIAFLFTTIPDVKAEILYQKAIIRTRFLKDYSSAISDLNSIIKIYPDTKFYEDAIFQRGFIEYERKNYSTAKKYFKEYIQKFPNGKFLNSVDLLIKNISFTNSTSTGAK